MWFICITAGRSNLNIMHDMVSAQVFSWSRAVTELSTYPSHYHLPRLQTWRKGVPIVWWQCRWFWSLPPLNIRKLANFFCICQWAWDTLLFCAVQMTNANISHYHPTINVEGLQKVPMEANNQKLCMHLKPKIWFIYLTCSCSLLGSQGYGEYGWFE